MNIHEFFNYNHICPICKGRLTKEAELDVVLDQIDGTTNDFSRAVSVSYAFNGKRFTRTSSYVEPKFEIVMNLLDKEWPKTFSINKRLNLRTNKSKLSDMIKPWFIEDFDIAVFRRCSGSGHEYNYASMCMYEGDTGSNIELSSESISVHGFYISNNLHWVNPYTSTNYGTTTSPEGWVALNNLPFIPISKWDTSSKESLKGHIEKYMLLK